MGFGSADPILEESVSAVTATNSVELGTRRTVNGFDYVYVYNAGNSQISVGKGACVSAVSGFSVTVSSLSGTLLVGVCKHATLTTATYGWLLTKGYVDSVTDGMASTGITAGDSIQAAADGAFCKGETGPFVGKAMTSTGSAGAFHAFISVY